MPRVDTLFKLKKIAKILQPFGHGAVGILESFAVVPSAVRD